MGKFVFSRKSRIWLDWIYVKVEITEHRNLRKLIFIQQNSIFYFIEFFRIFLRFFWIFFGILDVLKIRITVVKANLIKVKWSNGFDQINLIQRIKSDLQVKGQTRSTGPDSVDRSNGPQVSKLILWLRTSHVAIMGRGVNTGWLGGNGSNARTLGSDRGNTRTSSSLKRHRFGKPIKRLLFCIFQIFFFFFVFSDFRERGSPSLSLEDDSRPPYAAVVSSGRRRLRWPSGEENGTRRKLGISSFQIRLSFLPSRSVNPQI